MARFLSLALTAAILTQLSTSMVQKALPSEFTEHANAVFGGYAENFLVIPALKLALCTIPKNGYTQFRQLFEDVASDDRNDFEWDDVRPQHGNIDALFEDSSWTKAVFLRDPLARLVSGYKDKCTPPNVERSSRDCMNFEKSSIHSYPSFDQFVEKIDHFHNPHFDPQTSRCFLSSRLADYDFVGHLSDDYTKVANQVRGMLTSAARRVGRDTDERLSVLDQKARTYFPLAGPGSFTAGFTDHFHTNTNVEAMFHHEQTLNAALLHCAVDYVALHLEPPEWVSRARIDRAWRDARAKASKTDTEMSKERHASTIAQTR